MIPVLHKNVRLCVAFAIICLLMALTAMRASAFDDDYKEKINGTMLHFRVRGIDKKNPYLLMLHGGPGFSAHMFYPWGPGIEKALNVVYLDQRGCGESARYKFKNLYAPKPEETKDLTVGNMVKDLEGVREFLKLDRWYVLGHSWGGMLGIEYVAAFPDRILGFIDMDGAISFARIQDDILANCAARFAQDAKSSNADTREQGAKMLDQTKEVQGMRPNDPKRLFNALALALGPGSLYFAGDQPKAFADFMARITAAVQPYHIPPAELAQASEPIIALILNDGLPTRDVTPLLAKITVPTLILNGKEDGVVTPGMAQAAHEGIKGSTLILLDNCGHFPFAQQPDKTTTAILNFVKRDGRG
jgi:proline iminopeptidase